MSVAFVEVVCNINCNGSRKHKNWNDGCRREEICEPIRPIKEFVKAGAYIACNVSEDGCEEEKPKVKVLSRMDCHKIPNCDKDNHECRDNETLSAEAYKSSKE